MSRAAIYDALLDDQRLIDLGIDASSLLVNYDGDQRPNDTLFIVITWNPEDNAFSGDDVVQRRFKNATIWFHIYREESTDFKRIDDVMDIVDDIYSNMIHVAGVDGQTVTLIETAGRSRDMRDDIYQTICRSGTYRILSRETATV